MCCRDAPCPILRDAPCPIGRDYYLTVLQRQQWLVAHRWAHVTAVVLCDALLWALYALMVVALLGLAYLAATALGYGFVWLIETAAGKAAPSPAVTWGLSWLMGAFTAIAVGVVLFALVCAVVACTRCVTAPSFTQPSREVGGHESVPGDDDCDVSVSLEDQ